MLSRGIYKAVRLLCAAAFTALFVLVLCNNSLADIAVGAGLLALFALVCVGISKCSERVLAVLFVLLLIVFVYLFYQFGLLLRVRPSWDFGRIYAGAADYIQNGNLAVTQAYYLESLNNLFPTLWLAGFVKLSALFGPVSMFANMILLNALSVGLAILFLFLAARTALGMRTAFAAALLCFFSAPLFDYSPIVYTDTLSMPLLTLCLLLCVLGLRRGIGHRGALLLGAAAGIVAFIGYSLKPTAAFPLIAAAILVVLVRRDGLRFVLAAVAVFAAVSGFYQLWLHNTPIIDLSDIAARRLPPMHYIHMGLVGNGGYNGALHGAAAALPDDAARTANAQAEIAALLQEYGVGGTLAHLRAKLLYTWNDGLYFATQKVSQDIFSIGWAQRIVLTDGRYYGLWRGYAQGAQLAMLASLCAGSIVFAFRKNDPDEASIMPVVWITLLGVAGFLVLWETRSRYLVNCIPLFALCEAWAVCTLVRSRNRLAKRAKALAK